MATQVIYIGLTATDWKAVFATIRNTRRFIYADRRFFGAVAWLEEQLKSRPTDPHDDPDDDLESREAIRRVGQQLCEAKRHVDLLGIRLDGHPPTAGVAQDEWAQSSMAMLRNVNDCRAALCEAGRILTDRLETRDI